MELNGFSVRIESSPEMDPSTGNAYTEYANTMAKKLLAGDTDFDLFWLSAETPTLFKEGYFTDLASGEKESTNLPASDVLYFVLENGDKIIVRPSGTEPKVKIYFLAHGEVREALLDKLAAYKKDALAKANECSK